MRGKWQQDRSSDWTAGEGWILDDQEVDGRSPESRELRPSALKASHKRDPRAAVERERSWRPSGGPSVGQDIHEEQSAYRRPGSVAGQDGGTVGRSGLPFESDREVSLRESRRADQADKAVQAAPAAGIGGGAGQVDAAGEVAHIGRRRRLRPEVVALVLGGMFVVAALLKPWPNLPKSTASSQPSLLAAAATNPAPLISLPSPPGPAPTVDIYALIPPYNYRPGQWPPPTTGPAAANGTLPGASAWGSVDWSFLTTLDPHGTWGVAALTLPAVGPRNGQLEAATTWAKEVAPWSPSTLTVPRGSSVYGIALTWPAGLKVNSVTFDYLSLVSPKVGVTPVPARAVATPVLPTPGPARTEATGSSGTLTSGSFWIPPSGDLLSPVPSSLQSAWQSSPWPWPTGQYRASLDTNAGRMIVVLDLQPA